VAIKTTGREPAGGHTSGIATLLPQTVTVVKEAALAAHAMATRDSSDARPARQATLMSTDPSVAFIDPSGLRPRFTVDEMPRLPNFEICEPRATRQQETHLLLLTAPRLASNLIVSG
jgi:hypothetical protein